MSPLSRILLTIYVHMSWIPVVLRSISTSPISVCNLKGKIVSKKKIPVTYVTAKHY